MVTGEPKVSHSHPASDTEHTQNIICKAIHIRNPYTANKIQETYNSNYFTTMAQKSGKSKQTNKVCSFQMLFEFYNKGFATALYKKNRVCLVVAYTVEYVFIVDGCLNSMLCLYRHSRLLHLVPSVGGPHVCMSSTTCLPGCCYSFAIM